MTRLTATSLVVVVVAATNGNPLRGQLGELAKALPPTSEVLDVRAPA
jgi:hypothetical protein